MSFRMSASCLLVIGVLAGWAVANAQEAKVEPKAIAYVYRKKEFSTRTWRPSAYVDERELGRTQNGRYLVAKLSPGEHTFRSELAQEAIHIDLKAGQCYYFQTEIATGFWKAHGRLVSVAPEQAANDLLQLQPIDFRNVRDKTSVLSDDQLNDARTACASKAPNEAQPSVRPTSTTQDTGPGRP